MVSGCESMIVVIGPNPAIQKTITLPSPLVPDNVHRATSVTLGVGGKGQNVAIALHKLHPNSNEVELHQFGSSDTTGETLRSLLPASLQTSTTTSSTPVRTCTTLLSPDGIATEIIEPTPPITSDELTTFLASLSTFLTTTPSVVVCMGSVPPSTPPSFYGDCVKASNVDSSSTIVIDVSSLPLLQGLLDNCPKVKDIILKCNLSGEKLSWPIKINTHPNLTPLVEIEKMVGTPEKAFDLSPNLTHVVLTNGGNPAQFIARDTPPKYILIPPTKTMKSPIGAGDAVAAGLAFAIESEMNVHNAFIYGLKLGAAACHVSSCNGFDQDYFNELTK
ncbi:hypothetical protein TL16_g10077 [Triparma laevis f. inornata]|uniref:Carbohydrate kinase PfkB domain-containing protein n=1 Tax=Triparma laevis f. inornata TaxID=1714386 RepID=A0A9W7EPK5_9STRA|nr:hypothetical protein TL16_g10077 [Triparma laevis f. inornata]